MTEHVKTFFTVGHVLIGIGTEVDVSIETSGLQHFNQHRNDVAVNAFETVDYAVDGLAAFFPQAISVLGKASAGHQLVTLGEVKFTGL